MHDGRVSYFFTDHVISIFITMKNRYIFFGLFFAWIMSTSTYELLK